MLTFKSFLSESNLPTIQTIGLSSQGGLLLEKISPEKNTDHLDKQLSQHYKHDSTSTLKPHHLREPGDSGLTDFSTPGSSKLANDHLWRQHHNKKPITNTRINHFDRALNQHKTPFAFDVYTGLHHAPKSGTHVHPAYLHTSLDKSVAKQFANRGSKYEEEHHHTKGTITHVHRHILTVHVPKGHSGAYIAGHSEMADEKEFVLPRNSKLHIKDKNHTVTEKSKVKNGEFHEHTHTHYATIEK